MDLRKAACIRGSRTVCTIALAFVFIRIMGEAESSLFAFLPDAELRGVTPEWLSFVIPILAVESWYTRWPALRYAAPGQVGARAA